MERFFLDYAYGESAKQIPLYALDPQHDGE